MSSDPTDDQKDRPEVASPAVTSTSRVALIAVLLVVVIGGVVILLLTGGPPDVAEVSGEREGDVTLLPGPNPPTGQALADIVRARVTSDGDRLVFDAQLGIPVPNKIKDGELEVRWDIYEGAEATWQVSATIGVKPFASLVSYETGFGAGTFDDTMPGGIELRGDRVVILVEPTEVDGFPSEFRWELTTQLDGDRGLPGSARAQDRAPDEGYGEYRTPS